MKLIETIINFKIAIECSFQYVYFNLFAQSNVG